jgi:HK97 family phage portal protein
MPALTTPSSLRGALDTMRTTTRNTARALQRALTPTQQKAHRTSPFVAIDGPRTPAWAPRDYAAFAREGFMQNAIVYRSVRMIAEAAGNVPLLLYDGAHELTDHPLLDLVRRPNATATSVDLIEQLIGFLLVSGNGYLEAVVVGDQIRELHALRPDRMQVIPGPDGWPESYSYTIDGRASRIAGDAIPGVRRILHIKLFHPVNDHYGMSPIEAAASAIDLHNTAAKWNKALLDNSARPSGALVYTARDGNLTGEQYERLKRELESGFQGAMQAGRPLLLEGGLDWKSMSLTPKDMDFIEAKNAAAREIALALGVPPMLLGIPGDNTYSNYQEANRALWRQTVLPLVNRIAAALSSWLGASGEAALTFRPDLDAVEALNPERDALWTRLEAASFLTTDEKREAAGYDPRPSSGQKFNPNHHDRGRFDFKPDSDEPFTDDPDTSTLDDRTDGLRDPNIEDTAKRGGLPAEVLKWTFRQFVSKYCKGHINRELPGQFNDTTISDIIRLAEGGDAAANTCYKLLNQPRFRK